MQTTSPTLHWVTLLAFILLSPVRVWIRDKLWTSQNKHNSVLTVRWSCNDTNHINVWIVECSGNIWWRILDSLLILRKSPCIDVKMWRPTSQPRHTTNSSVNGKVDLANHIFGDITNYFNPFPALQKTL